MSEITEETVKRATVLGGGAFGTAMAQLLAFNQIQVSMWVREAEVKRSSNHRDCYFDEKIDDILSRIF